MAVLTAPIQLICIDIDGTLLRSDKTISLRTKQVVRKAEDRGIMVALVSARMRKSVQEFQEQLGIQGPVGLYNGALVLDTQSTPILEHHLTIDEVRRCVAAVAKTGIRFSIFTKERWYAPPVGYWANPEYHSEINILPMEMIEEYFRAGEYPFKISCSWEDPDYLSEAIELINQQIGDGFTILRSGAHYLEIFRKGVDKGDAVRCLINHYMFNAAQVVAIGDYYNDVGMFKASGVSVAMGNAPDGVKKMASRVTTTNDEDGVALAIEEVLGEENMIW